MTTSERILPTAQPTVIVRTLVMAFLSLMDQVSISGVRFLTTIFLVRFAKPELGIYHVSFGFLLIATCLLESLIAAPFNLYFDRDQGKARATYHGSILLIVAGLATFASSAFAIAWLLIPSYATLGLAGAIGSLAVAAPMLILREFARRVEIARLRVGYSVLIDGSAAILQVVLLVLLIQMEWLHASTVYLAIGLSAAIPAFIWLAIRYRGNRYDLADAKRQLLRHWKVARWPLVAQIVGLLQLHGTIWIIGGMLGLEEAGHFSAVYYVLLVMNPLALGACSFITPLAVRTFTASGVNAVRKMIGGFMLAFGGIICLLTIVVTIASDWILELLYEDPSYQGQWFLLLLLGINMTLGVMHMINDQGVWATGSPRWLLHSTLIAALTTMIFAIPLVAVWHLYGAACGLILGRLFGLLYQSYHFFFSPPLEAVEAQQAKQAAADLAKWKSQRRKRLAKKTK